MKILVIGKGGREHAVICSLKKSKKISKIYCAPGNGGTAIDAENVPIDELNKIHMKNFVKEKNVDLVIVTPDNPLADGMVDYLQKYNIKAFGPKKLAAKIESSKAFAKNFMKKYNIPTAKYEIFEDANLAIAYIKKNSIFPIVIKADGLAFGKGVVIAKNFVEAKKEVEDILINKKFKESGNKIVVEEFLQGIETSVLCLTDGKTIKPMISSMDHKRVKNNNEGLNTGGMGAFAPNPLYTTRIAERCVKTIFKPTISGLNNEGIKFKGCLYFGLILTKNGPKVIEYNCRLGDPEAQVVLSLLKNDLLSLIESTINEKLCDVELEFSNKSAVCIVMTSKGYPSSYETGFLIKNLNEQGQISSPNIKIYHAGTKLENNKFITSGGRVLGVCCVDNNLQKAISRAYDTVEKIKFENSYYRTDIGHNMLTYYS